MEYVIAEQATVMVKRKHATQTFAYKVTGWMVTLETDGSVSLKGKETHASYNGKHMIFTDGKLSNSENGLGYLIQEGIVRFDL